MWDIVLAWSPSYPISPGKGTMTKFHALIFAMLSMFCDVSMSDLNSTSTLALSNIIIPIFHVLYSGWSSIQSTFLSHILCICSRVVEVGDSHLNHHRMSRLWGMWDSERNFQRKKPYVHRKDAAVGMDCSSSWWFGWARGGLQSSRRREIGMSCRLVLPGQPVQRISTEN